MPDWAVKVLTEKANLSVFIDFGWQMVERAMTKCLTSIRPSAHCKQIH